MPKDQLRQSKSPLKEPPLRTPGQSLSEEIEKGFEDRAMAFAFAGLVLLGMAVLEWVRWALRPSPCPVVFSIGAVLGCAFATWRIWRLYTWVKPRVLGLQGERAVGQELEELREKGYRVFHDIVGDGHNIDHVLVGPGGVFAIETKTHRKPARGQSKIVFDGEKVTINGHTPDRNPVHQVQAAARELKGIVHSTTGRDVKVQPVLLYPGWFVQPLPRGSALWVLNPKAPPSFLDKEPGRLAPEDIALVAYGIATRVRNTT